LVGRSRQRTLLLVDDEENIIAALRRLLRAEGWLVLSATSAEHALELMARHEVDVILSDQRMPGMSGVELLRLCRDIESLSPGAACGSGTHASLERRGSDSALDAGVLGSAAGHALAGRLVQHR
jgi:CheY-like chemotaxis protein